MTFFRAFAPPQARLSAALRSAARWSFVVSTPLILLSFALGVGLGPSATAAPTARFVAISVDQGLSQSTVQAIVQDHLGFIWIGTEEGLNRYDGYGFVVYKHDGHDENSLPDNAVAALFEDSRHRMWVGTEHGLCRFDPRTEKFTSIKAIRDRVSRIIETTDGTIWVAAVGGGLFLLPANSDRFVSYQPVATDPMSLASYQPATLLQDHSGRLWIGTSNAGLERFVPHGKLGYFVHYRHQADNPKSLAYDEVSGLAEDRRGRIWVAMYGGGIDVLDPATGAFQHYRHHVDDPNSLPTDLITAAFADQDGTLWFGSDGAGLLRYDPDTDRFTSITHRAGDNQSLNSNVVRTIYQDRQAHLWVGTFLGGVSEMKEAHPEFAYFIHDDEDPTSLSDRAVASFTEDQENRIWLGTEGGWLNRFDRERQSFARYRYPSPSGANSAILALHCDRRGRIWVGTYRGGFARFDPTTGSFTVYRHDPKNPLTISDDEVWTIAEDAKGMLWLGTNAGVDRFDPDRAEVVEHLKSQNPAGLNLTGVRSLAFDAAGNLWIGTFGGVTMRSADGERFAHFQHQDGDPHSLGNNAVAVLHVDTKDRIWAGTLGGGIGLLDPTRGIFTMYDDFPSNVVNAIEEDPRGRLWISTDHGLSRFTPSSGLIESYDLTNGLQTLQFHLGAGLRTHDGRLLFGSNDGMYDIDPSAIKASTYTPPVVLTSLRIFNVPAKLPVAVAALDKITLQPDDKIIAIEFAALDYTFPRRNQYAYQFTGLSDRWITLGEKREITFTNLAPATYTLRIKASNSDGVWRDGSSVTLRVTVLPPFWATWWFRGGALGLVGSLLFGWHRGRIRRLTEKLVERRRAEAALRASEERFSRAFHVSPVPMCIVRLGDRTFVDLNNAFLKLVGYTHAELIGRSLDQVPLVIPEDRQRASVAMGKTNGFAEVDFRVRTKSGEMRTILASVAITELGGQPCALGVGADITERERAEKARRDSEERYRRFFNEDLAGAFICNPDGRLLVCNPAFARMFGFNTAAEAVGADLFDLYVDRAAGTAVIARLRAEHKVQDIEQEMCRRDGKPVHVIANIIGTFDEQQILVGINGYVIDTTERKKLEAQLLQSQKMEAVGQLAGGVAHDFNNLLTGIIGYTDLLLMGDNLGDETCASLNEIRAAGSRAAALTRQLLAFSRRQLLQPRVIDLNALVADMENMLRRLIGEDVDLKILLASDLGRIKADRSQVEQVILNLAVNARDAMPRGGQLTIETTNVVLDETYAANHVGVDTGNYVRLTVSDTGCGMDPEIQARIFEPFFTTKAVGKGTGLGLSTVYGIVKQSNGHIDLYSERDVGSSFKVYLPRADAAPVLDEPVGRNRPLARGTETVLLVEDNEVVRKATAQILRQNGYHVIEGRDPADALDLFESTLRPIDLLVTDVIMPGMNGRELAEMLLARAPALRVLYMSGYTDDAIMRHGGLNAEFVFLEKPFSPATLLGKVQEALRQRPAGSKDGSGASADGRRGTTVTATEGKS